MTRPIEDAPLPAGDVERTIKLTQHTLGLDPYVLIRAVKADLDPDDEADDGFRLQVEYGGGADGPDLACLLVLNLPAEQNPFTAAIKAVIEQTGAARAMRVDEVLGLFAQYCDIPMPAVEE